MVVHDFANFQGMSTQQGIEFRNHCVAALRANGFVEIRTEVRFPDVGIKLDIVATNRHGISLAIECKGSFQGERPGSKRTDSVLKAIGEALLFRQSEEAVYFPPLILMTSHIAGEKAARLQLGAVPVAVIADVFGPYHTRRLQWWADADSSDIETYLATHDRVEELLRGW